MRLTTLTDFSLRLLIQLALRPSGRATIADMALAPCFAGADCAILPACRLKHALHAAREAFLAVLDATTLADLAQPEAELRRLLNIAA
jgi:Rrf2 family nitric oxide-sensitive transcriptional repressor